MRKLLLVAIPLLALFAFACKSEPPVGPGVVKITETTTSIPTTTTTTIPIPTVSLFAFTPQTPEVLQIVNFDGSLSTPGTNRSIVRYSWDFGEYLVTLVVTDDSGATARSSQPITVRPKLPAPASLTK